MMKHQKIVWTFLCLALVLIALRLPAVYRPVSKHHEFNTAVILINAISWKQAGGGSPFYWTPLMNFQGEPNRVLETGPHVDAKGNHVYLSFGPGWYVFPYAVFELLNLPPEPVYLRILSILTGILSFWMLTRLLGKMGLAENRALWWAFFFCILPGPLWYMGTGYINIGIMMPLVLWILMLWNRASAGHPLSPGWYLQLFIAGIALIYFDWYPVFLFAGLFWWAAFNLPRPTRYTVMVVAVITVMAGFLVVLIPFSMYLGTEQVLNYWQLRFGERGIAGKITPDTRQLAFSIILNITSSMLPLLLAALWIYRKQRVKWSFRHWTVYLLLFTLMYNIIFLDWSAVHEFAWLPLTLAIALLLAPYLKKNKPIKNEYWLLGISGAAALIIYFLINLPGPKSISGEPYDSYKNAGNFIRTNVPDSTYIFSNASPGKIVEYFSGRTINYAPNIQSAMQLKDSLNLKSCVFYQPDSSGQKGKMKLTPIP